MTFHLDLCLMLIRRLSIFTGVASHTTRSPADRIKGHPQLDFFYLSLFRFNLTPSIDSDRNDKQTSLSRSTSNIFVSTKSMTCLRSSLNCKCLDSVKLLKDEHVTVEYHVLFHKLFLISPVMYEQVFFKNAKCWILVFVL